MKVTKQKQDQEPKEDDTELKQLGIEKQVNIEKYFTQNKYTNWSKGELKTGVSNQKKGGVRQINKGYLNKHMWNTEECHYMH